MSVPEPACLPLPTIAEFTAVPSKYVEIPVIVGQFTFIPGENVILAGHNPTTPIWCITISGETLTDFTQIINYENAPPSQPITCAKQTAINLYPHYKFYRLSDKTKAYNLRKEYMTNESIQRIRWNRKHYTENIRSVRRYRNLW